jgi:hypothetical protein
VTQREPSENGLTFRALEIPPDIPDEEKHIEILQDLNKALSCEHGGDQIIACVSIEHDSRLRPVPELEVDNLVGVHVAGQGIRNRRPSSPVGNAGLVEDHGLSLFAGFDSTPQRYQGETRVSSKAY